MSDRKLHSPQHDDQRPARLGGAHAASDSEGAVTTDADVAGMIGPAGVTRPILWRDRSTVLSPATPIRSSAISVCSAATA